MKVATILVRSLLGLMFVVFGSNAFLHFLPMPEMKGYPGEFIGSMNATGYLQFIAALQIIGGALLLAGKFVPLGLTLLGPIVVNIVAYHLFMDRAGMPIALAAGALSLFLLWSYRAAFAGLARA